MKNLQKLSILFFALVLFSFSACKKDEIKPKAGATVQSLINQIEKSFESGGVIASVRNAAGTTDTGVLGNSEANQPIKAEMSMGIGSNTKTFTSALVFKLIEEEKLNLADKLSDILPAVVSDKVNGEITIQQLLTHSSGIFDPLNGDDSVINDVFEDPARAYTLNDYLELLEAPVFAPGEKHDYSNTNYILLGTIIEQQSEMTYLEYLRTNILDPLNMTNTFLMGYEEPTNAIAYSWYEGESLKDFDRAGIESLAWSAGSIFSTADDLATWYNALFSGQIINEASLEEMLTAYQAETDAYGAGIFKRDYNNNEIYYHTGQTIAYNSMTVFNKTTGDFIIVMVNQIDNDANNIAFSILDSLLLE